VLPRGKLLYEKLVDAVGPAATHAAVDAYLRRPTPGGWLATLEAAGVRTAEVVLPWLAPYPRVDYALGPVVARGDAEGGHVDVEVQLAGPDAATLREPVTVEVVGADGVARRATRVGPGTIGVEGPVPP